jgi:hypothetical protein
VTPSPPDQTTGNSSAVQPHRHHALDRSILCAQWFYHTHLADLDDLELSHCSGVCGCLACQAARRRPQHAVEICSIFFVTTMSRDANSRAEADSQAADAGASMRSASRKSSAAFDDMDPYRPTVKVLLCFRDAGATSPAPPGRPIGGVQASCIVRIAFATVQRPRNELALIISPCRLVCGEVAFVFVAVRITCSARDRRMHVVFSREPILPLQLPLRL